MERPWLRPIGTLTYWKRRYKSVFGKTFSYLGTVWVIVRIVENYWPSAQECIPWWTMLLPLLLALFMDRPKRHVKHRIEDTDVDIEIRIGNILQMNGAIVVSTNSTFDTASDSGLISDQSLQGQFTKMYYDKEECLDRDIDRQLKGQQYEKVSDRPAGKRRKYPIGTAVKLLVRDRVAYFVAIADMNVHGVAHGSKESLVEALGNLWYFIGEQGELGRVLVPVLGTGRARIQVTRDVAIRWIIDSFIAACSERKICDEMTIVISEQDYFEHQLDLDVLGRYVQHKCVYAHGGSDDRPPTTTTSTGLTTPFSDGPHGGGANPSSPHRKS